MSPLSLTAPAIGVKKLDVIVSFSTVVYLAKISDFFKDHGSKLDFAWSCLMSSCFKNENVINFFNHIFTEKF